MYSKEIEITSSEQLEVLKAMVTDSPEVERLQATNADLLAALEGMVEDYQEAYGGGDLDEEPSALKQARAAIAKTKS